MTVDLQRADSTIPLFQQAAAILREDDRRDGSVIRLPASGHLTISGDLHDHVIHLEKIRATARLDADRDRHVILQELIHGPSLTHGCDVSYRMLGKVAQDILRYPGQVHPVLGNHELAQRTRSGVSKGGGNNVELFNDGLDMVFGDDHAEVADAIDAFIDAMPLAVVTERGLMCSHSLPAANAMGQFDAAVLERIPTPDDQRGPWGSAYLLVWGRRFTDEQLTELADRWGVTHFCVGHAWVEMGIERSSARHVSINSDHERGMVIPWDLSRTPSVDDLISSARYLQAIGITA